MPDTPTAVFSPPGEQIIPARGTNPLQDCFIQLDQAEQLRRQGKLERAQKICDALLREHPDYVAALHTRGLIYADKKNYEQALNCLVRAAMLHPHYCSTLTALSGIYLELKANEMAAKTLEEARALEPNNPNVLITLGEIYRQEREYELAKEAFTRALEIENDLVPAAVGLGWVCLYLGQNAEAVATFENLLKRGVRSFEIVVALSYAPSSITTVDLLAELDKLNGNREQDPTFQNRVAFVRATALDKAGRHREAWEQIVPANRTVFAGVQDDLRDSLARQKAMLAALRTTPIKSSANDEQKPISLFILGPSRSGKTTMEMLVASLDGVKRGYENPSVENAIRRSFQTAGLITSSLFEMLPPQLYNMCRKNYASELSSRAANAKVFTNTHPGRIFDAALIATVFPNVRFIFMKRNLDDIILRIYQRMYREWNPYAYDLKAARDYVLWYYQMIDALAQRLPDKVRIINYEDMVEDPTGALRIAADLCGLKMPENHVLAVADDRGCAAPYIEFISARQHCL